MKIADPCKFVTNRVARMSNRRASVLLLVIVLLLLLSILGTAFISTSHTDRINSQQTLLNVQSEANFDGFNKAVAGLFIDDLNDPLDHLRGAVSPFSLNGHYVGVDNPLNPYNLNDIVNDPANPNNYYQAIAAVPAGNPVPNALYWSLIPAGSITGNRSSFRGTWNPNIQYEYGDIVISIGAIYYANNPAAAPGLGVIPPGAGWLAITGHVPFTGGGAQPWLADRIPSVSTPATLLGGTAQGINQPFWQNISQSIVSAGPTGSVSVLGLPFESPDGSTMFATALSTKLPPLYPGFATLNGVTVPTLSDQTLTTIPQPAGMISLPLQAGDPNANGIVPKHIVVAADADGDGIADSLLFRIPGANYDGLTWYAAVRIVDNNSAINANTAWTRDNEYSYPNSGGNVVQLTNWGFFQSNIGLLEMVNEGACLPTAPVLHAGGDIVPVPLVAANYPSTAALIIAPPFNEYRWNNNTLNGQPMNGQTTPVLPTNRTMSPTYTIYSTPIDETWNPTTFTAIGQVTPRDTDFVYISPSDQLYHQLITRLDNPGFSTYNTNVIPNAGVNRFQAIPLSDEAALAYHAGLPNTSSGTTLLESLLPVSLNDYQNNRGVPPNPIITSPNIPPTAFFGVDTGSTATKNYLGISYNNGNYPLPTTPYGGNPLSDVEAWWYENYDYGMLNSGYPIPNFMPLRSLLVTRNPISNYITPVYDSGFLNPQQPINTLPTTLFPTQKLPLGETMLPYNTTNLSARLFNAAATYQASDVVQFNGIYFRSNIDGNTGNPPAIVNAAGDMTAYNPNWSTWGQYKGVWDRTAVYRFNDWVTGGDGKTYISVNDTNVGNAPTAMLTAGILAGYPQNLQYWQPQSISRHPAKTNVNTATFRELYRAFWSVMAGNPANSCPFGPTPGGPAGNYVVGPPDTSDSPYTTAGAWTTPPPPLPNVPWHMFRSVLRDPTAPAAPTTPNTFMDPTNVMALRAALAAVNTLGLRDQSQNIISRTVWLTAYVAGAPKVVEARVYSAAPNPVISEVFVNTNTSAGTITDTNAGGGQNPNGYIAIQLYNPYPAAINMSNWQIGMVNRATAGTYPNLQFTGAPLFTFPAGTSIQANSYMILENFNSGSGTTDATYRPANLTPTPAPSGPTTMPAAGAGQYPLGSATRPFTSSPTVNNYTIYTPALDPLIQAGGGEMVLLRPRRQDGTYTMNIAPNPISGAAPPTYDPMNIYNEGQPATPNLYDLVPVDSYDFTGIIAPSAAATTAFTWSYIRPTLTNTNVNVPAGISPFEALHANQYSLFNGTTSRQTGTEILTETPALPDPTLVHATSFDSVQTQGSFTNQFPPLQVYNAGMPGPNPTLAINASNPSPPGPQKFPYGGFARNGDMLNISYIGAYRLRVVDPTVNPDPTTNAPFPPIAGNTEANFLELNSLPMDATLADDGDTTDDLYENVGRFCPVTSSLFTPTAPSADWYGWAGRLFDYLTVQSNNSDFMPNIDPGYNDVGTDTVTGLQQPTYPYASKYWPGSNSPNPASPGADYTSAFSPPTYMYTAPPTPSVPPNPIYNADATATDQSTQDNVGVDGLININTAGWKVLSMLPFVTPADDAANWAADNEAIGQAIVTYRNTNGPFTSIFDLNKVAEFQTAAGHFAIDPIAPPGSDPTLMGVTGTADTNFPSGGTNVAEDYRSTNMVLNRVSNLITTRSDTFTVYIVIEGWQNPVLTPLAAGATPPNPPPALKVVKRYAFIADRSQINSDINTRFLKTLVIPNN
jgi:hypothetical protein